MPSCLVGVCVVVDGAEPIFAQQAFCNTINVSFYGGLGIENKQRCLDWSE